MVTDETPPELSRLVKVRSLPGKAIVVEASAGERKALAHRFGLPGIDTLHAEVTLDRAPRAIRATGTLTAAIRQTCVISGEDFPATIEENFDLRFVEDNEPPPPDEADAEIAIELDAEDCDEIGYRGDAIDLGEAVAQTLGLAIDPYAKGPNADEAREQAGISSNDEHRGPLAESLAASLAAFKEND